MQNLELAATLAQVPAAVAEAKRSYMGLVQCSNEEYHSAPGISKSHLDTIAGRSPKHYWHRYLNPDREPEAQTPAKILGTAIHAAILEPDLFTSGFVPNPGIERRSNAGKAEWAAFCAENTGKVILSDEDYQACLKVRDAVYADELAGGLLRVPGKSEQSFWALEPDTGELIKCRYDRLLDDGSAAVDVKSTDDASPAGFGKSVWNYRYHLQPPWYFDVLDILYNETPRAWAFLAVEKEPPYAVGVYYATPEQMSLGREIARRDFMRIVEHKRSGKFPGYTAGGPLPVEFPGWAKARI